MGQERGCHCRCTIKFTFCLGEGSSVAKTCLRSAAPCAAFLWKTDVLSILQSNAPPLCKRSHTHVVEVEYRFGSLKPSYSCCFSFIGVDCTAITSICSRVPQPENQYCGYFEHFKHGGRFREGAKGEEGWAHARCACVKRHMSPLAQARAKRMIHAGTSDPCGQALPRRRGTGTLV